MSYTIIYEKKNSFRFSKLKICLYNIKRIIDNIFMAYMWARCKQHVFENATLDFWIFKKWRFGSPVTGHKLGATTSRGFKYLKRSWEKYGRISNFADKKFTVWIFNGKSNECCKHAPCSDIYLFIFNLIFDTLHYNLHCIYILLALSTILFNKINKLLFFLCFFFIFDCWVFK